MDRTLRIRCISTGDVEHFLASTGKPFLQVTLADLQGFADSLGELAPASRYRTLSAINSLLAFAHWTR
jgi:hypothetical protein